LGSAGHNRIQKLKREIEEGKITDPDYIAFFEKKVKDVGYLSSIYGLQGAENLEHTKAEYFAANQQRVVDTVKFITDEIPKYLGKHIFIDGDEPGEADFHVGAWLARALLLIGGNPGPDGIAPLDPHVDKVVPGAEVPQVVKEYWVNWSARPSWLMPDRYKCGILNNLDRMIHSQDGGISGTRTRVVQPLPVLEALLVALQERCVGRR
jgi:hypothetical protein